MRMLPVENNGRQPRGVATARFPRIPFQGASFVIAATILLLPLRLLHVESALGESPPNSQESAADFFERRIRPLFVNYCHACHSGSAKQIESGFRLDNKAELIKGGNRGVAIVPGDPKSSLLLRAVRGQIEDLQMPPKSESSPLDEQQIADLESWIANGAYFPENPAMVSEAAGGFTAAQHAHWAFQPVTRPSLPIDADDHWSKNEVDRFILAKLQKHGLPPSPQADRRTLLRRAKFDLLGLPPTWEEIQQFENDPSPSAYEDLIEKYLASPHYGERWGRYWLDAARYADTKGYAYSREERRFVHAHVYRDWVVKAFNDDMPYDQFLLRQIAADQLDEGDNHSLAAMGFITVGRRFINVKHDIIDDRIDVVCRTTLGLSVSCARCHDHKFDPIPTKDYYSLFGVFDGSTDRLVALNSAASAAETNSPANQELASRVKHLDDAFQETTEELLEQVRGMVEAYFLEIPRAPELPFDEFYNTMGADEINPIFVRQWYEYIQSLDASDSIFACWKALGALPPEEFSARSAATLQALFDSGVSIHPLVKATLTSSPISSMRDTSQRYGKLFAEAHQTWKKELEARKAANEPAPTALSDPHLESLRSVLYGPASPVRLPPGTPAELEFFFAEAAREKLGQAQAKIDQWIVEGENVTPHAVAMFDRGVQHSPRVLIRGNPKQKGVETPRQFLAILAGPARQPFQKGSGRLELAKAIVDPKNPLTARVMVNRVWQHHFSTGIVATPSDFGLRGDPPSHPELLDYLASVFMESGWSVKHLHRQIMLSATYQQESGAQSQGNLADPTNRLLWRAPRRRLDLEASRDGMLQVSGALDPQVGGRAVDLTSRPFSHKRTLYGYIDRLNLPGMYRSFDFAGPDTHSPQRHQTTVPQQSLFLLNHPFVMERAREVAARELVVSAASPRAKIEALYRCVLARSPTPEEIELALSHVDNEEPGDPTQSSSSPWSYVFGPLNQAAEQPGSLAPLPFFTNGIWHAGPQIPELKCGWPTLTGKGGDPGRQTGMAVVRRWTSPCAGIVNIAGSIQHSRSEGDGIRARVIHGKLGELASWNLHKLQATCQLDGIPVAAGDTLDFSVEGRHDWSHDDFDWAPSVSLTPTAEADQIHKRTWDAQQDFAGPADPALGSWERLAQVLLISNEFFFVD